MDNTLRRVFATDAGMAAMWQPEHFASIVDYPSWERELLNDQDISRHIAAGTFVPLNIGADGAFDYALRIGSLTMPAVLSEREKKYLTIASDPYLFRSRGLLAISGLEYVGRLPEDAAAIIPLADADWTVEVHLIDWESEPGARTIDHQPSQTALSDFVVLINPSISTAHFRTRVETFERPVDI